MYHAYDFDKVSRLIEENKGKAIEIELGTLSDWFFTAETIWTVKDGLAYPINEETFVAGIQGSNWDLPVMRINFGDDNFKQIDVSKDIPDGEMELFCKREAASRRRMIELSEKLVKEIEEKHG